MHNIYLYYTYVESFFNVLEEFINSTYIKLYQCLLRILFTSGVYLIHLQFENIGL